MFLGGIIRANFLVMMIFMSMIYDSGNKKIEDENSCLKNVKVFALFAKRLKLCHGVSAAQPQSRCVESEQTEGWLGFSCDRDEANIERRTPSSSLYMRTLSVTRKTSDKELQATESSPVNVTKQFLLKSTAASWILIYVQAEFSCRGGDQFRGIMILRLFVRIWVLYINVADWTTVVSITSIPQEEGLQFF